MATREIRRYSNRKLYDTTDGHYVRLDDVAALVRRGEDVIVRDHATTRDLTAQTLAQCIFEEEKRKHAEVSSPGAGADVYRSILRGSVGKSE